MIRHFQDAADVRRLVPVEEELRLGRVGVHAVGALQEPESDQRVEEVTRRAWVQAETSLHVLQRAGPPGEIREELHLDGTQQHLRRHEPQTDLHDVFGRHLASGRSDIGHR